MSWVFLSIFAGFCDAIIFALMKKAKEMPGLLVVFAEFFFSIPILLLSLFFFFPETINSNVYWLGFLNGIILIATKILLFRAFQASNLSLTIPMLSFTPLFLLVTSPLILGESPGSAIGYLGILFIVGGAYFLNLKKEKHDLLAPLKALWTRVGTRCALGAALLMSIMANLFKIGVEYSNPFFYNFYLHIVMILIMLPYFLFKMKDNISVIRKNLGLSLGLGVANACMQISAGIAVLTAIVPFMISLKRSSVLFGMGFSYFMFKEKHVGGRLVGASIMLIGAVMIILS